jgi:flagellar biosynthesis regulator FlbT
MMLSLRGAAVHNADYVRQLELSLAQCRSRIVDEMKVADDLGEACEWFHSLRHHSRSEFDDEVKAMTAVEKMDAAVEAWRAARIDGGDT